MSVKCNIKSKTIWELCNENGCWISVEHVPCSHNTIANYMSQTLNENTEWKLSPFLFLHISERFQFTADIDFFASYLNMQLSNYVPWHPNQESVGVDAFNMPGTKLKFYAFPPFNPKLVPDNDSYLWTTLSFSCRRKPHWHYQSTRTSYIHYSPNSSF